MKKNNLLNITDEYSYKPFRYPDAYNLYSVHEDLHWTKKEIELSSDAKDWNTKATDVMKNRIQHWFKVVAAPYKYPRVINFVECLPKTETGKIQRFKLK